MSASGQEILLNIAQWLDQDISIDRISDLSLVLPVHSELTQYVVQSRDVDKNANHIL